MEVKVGRFNARFSRGFVVQDEWGFAWVCGAAFANGEMHREERLAERVLGCTSQKQLQELVSSANGFFSLVRVGGNSAWLAVDRLRSRPLFYCNAGDKLLIGDSPEEVVRELGGLQLDPVSVGELALAGFVSGTHTIDPRVHQIPAGEIAEIRLEKGQHAVVRHCYSSFSLRGESSARSRDELLQELSEVFRQAIDRLCRYADGRQIVVPLSGGLDSRLICLGLRDAGYPRIQTFTYGVPGNSDSTVSEQVAKALNLPWTFVPYSQSLWREVWGSSRFASYCDDAESFASVAHIQDWPATKRLVENGRIERDAIVAPGTTGDFPTGYHFSVFRDLFDEAEERDTPVKSIWKYFYTLNQSWEAAHALGISERRLRHGIKRRVLEEIALLPPENRGDNPAKLLGWEWKYRHSNFLVNSVRTYEFFGLDWWLPLADADYVWFWRGVPDGALLGQALYLDLLREWQNHFGIDCGLESHVAQRLTSGEWRKQRLIRWAQSTRVGCEGLAAWRTLRRVYDRAYEGHPLAWYGVVDFDTFRRQLRSTGNINTIIAWRQVEHRISQARGTRI